jgi:hypothetical protein
MGPGPWPTAEFELLHGCGGSGGGGGGDNQITPKCLCHRACFSLVESPLPGLV